MNIEKLKALETDKNTIDNYIGRSAFGRNKIIYLPLLAGIGLLVFVILAFYENLLDTIGAIYVYGCLALGIICLFVTKLIHNNSKQKLRAITTSAPTCVAVKVVGNDDAKVYYCIYTTEQHRHDVSFIYNLKNKIEEALAQPHSDAGAAIKNYFKIKLSAQNEYAKKLPLSFTNNILVWVKEVSLAHQPQTILDNISQEIGCFAMIAISPENPQFLREYYQ